MVKTPISQKTPREGMDIPEVRMGNYEIKKGNPFAEVSTMAKR